MDLLENLYQIENFGIYLFIIIGILIVLFLVILFFGKKDEKKRKQEKVQENQEKIAEPQAIQKPMEEENLPLNESPMESVESMPQSVNVNFSFKEMETPGVPLEVPSPIFEETKAPDLTEFTLNQREEEPMQEQKEEKEFDFDALADAINKELTSIEKSEEKIEPILTKKEEIPLQYAEIQKESEPVIEPPKEEKKVMPTVFSSVYVNREKEQPMTKTEEDIEPTVPKIELPKMIDLPKKNQD